MKEQNKIINIKKNNNNAYEKIESNGKIYEIISRDENGKINKLRRFNERTKMWINLTFENDMENVDTESILLKKLTDEYIKQHMYN